MVFLRHLVIVSVTFCSGTGRPDLTVNFPRPVTNYRIAELQACDMDHRHSPVLPDRPQTLVYLPPGRNFHRICDKPVVSLITTIHAGPQWSAMIDRMLRLITLFRPLEPNHRPDVYTL